MSYDKPFAGLKVIDVSQGVAGPYCAMLLAQYGANVIKVEPPGVGDWARNLGVVYGDQCAYSLPANLGKRAIALDLKQDDGRAILWRLIKGADVFLQGFRPGVIDRLGFGYDAVSEREPRIIYLSVSGFGQMGPLAERPAMDPILQAYTGLTVENRGEDGIPHRTPIIAIDMSTALYAYSAVSTALYAQARRDARPPYRGKPDAGGGRASGGAPDAIVSRGRRHQAAWRSQRRLSGRRWLDDDHRGAPARMARLLQGGGTG